MNPLPPINALHEALTELSNHYENKKHTLSNQRMLQSIFSNMTKEFAFSLNDREIHALHHLHEDLSNAPLTNHPRCVEYFKILSSIFPLPPSAHSDQTISTPKDTTLQSWAKKPQESPEKQAYDKITIFLSNPKSPPLDLSKLGLYTLPSCLFTDPRLANVDISGNRIARFPENLLIGSICNMDTYEKVSAYINGNIEPSKNPLEDPNIVAHTLEFIKENTAEVNKNFKAGQDLKDLKKMKAILHEYQDIGYIQDIDITKLRPEECKKLGKALEQQTQDHNLILIFPKILEALTSTHPNKIFSPPDKTSSKKAAADIIYRHLKSEEIRFFLQEHQEDLLAIEQLKLNSLNLTRIPKEIKLFHGICSIDLSRNQLESIARIQFPEGLQCLYLSHNEISSFTGVQFPIRLEILDLLKNPILSIEGAHFPASLTFLFINKLSPEEIQKLESEIHVLDIRHH